MKTPYQLLGVPGNATTEDIEIAFGRAKLLYPPKRLADDEGALERFNQIKSAYDILLNADFRAGLDRKLASGRPLRAASAPVSVTAERSPLRSAIIVGACVVGLMFAGGAYVRSKNAEAARVQAALELAKQQQDAVEAEQRRVADLNAEAERRRVQARDEAIDRRSRIEAQYSASRVMIDTQRQEMNALQAQRMQAADQARRDAEIRNQERRDQQDAQMRLNRDKAQIRQLCIQQYRRADC